MLSLIFSMFAGIRRRSLVMWRDRGGAVAVMMAATLPAIVAFAALAIDMSYAYWTRTQLQHAASAAALAGVQEIVDEAPDDGQADNDAYRDAAIEFAYKNMQENRFGKIIQSSCGIYNPATNTVAGSDECADVKAGNWDPDARMFTAWNGAGFNPATMELDAVRVWTRKAQMNGNPLNLFLSAYVGLAQTDISTVAIAWNKGGTPPPDCFQNGMIAGGWLRMQSTNAYTNDYCMYGRDGVQVQSGNTFETGVKVGFGPGGYLDEQGGPNLGLDEAILDPPQIVEPLLAQNIDNLIADLEIGTYPSFVDFNGSSGIWEGTQAEWESITPIPHTTYIVDGQAKIDSYVSNIVVIADKIIINADIDHAVLIAKPPSPELIDGANIDIGSWVDMDYIVVAAYNRINLGSNGSLGGGLCDGAGVTVQVFAKEDVVFQSEIDISNAQIAAGRDVNMESNNAINLTGDGATIQAIGDIKLQTDGTYGACSTGGGGEPPPGPAVSLDLRLVH